MFNFTIIVKEEKNEKNFLSLKFSRKKAENYYIFLHFYLMILFLNLNDISKIYYYFFYILHILIALYLGINLILIYIPLYKNQMFLLIKFLIYILMIF